VLITLNVGDTQQLKDQLHGDTTGLQELLLSWIS